MTDEGFTNFAMGIVTGIAVLTLLIFGFHSGKETVKADCDGLGKFRIKEESYECRKATP